MKFAFAAALFAIASGAAPDASSVSQSQAAELITGYLRGGINNTTFVRRLDILNRNEYPEEYDTDTGCLSPVFVDKCKNCMCLNGPIGGAYPTKRCDLNAPGDGTDHCGYKAAVGEICTHNWQCQSNKCFGSWGNMCS